MLDLRIEGANKLREMALQLRKADKEFLGRRLGEAIRRAAEPALEDFRQAARNIHTTGERKPGARHRFTRVVAAKGTREKIAASITARVSLFSDNPRVQFRTGQGLPASIAMMPQKFERGLWRHPVMGNRDVWVSQRSDPWFYRTAQRGPLDKFRGEIDKALDDTRAMLERG